MNEYFLVTWGKAWVCWGLLALATTSPEQLGTNRSRCVLPNCSFFHLHLNFFTNSHMIELKLQEVKAQIVEIPHVGKRFTKNLEPFVAYWVLPVTVSFFIKAIFYLFFTPNAKKTEKCLDSRPMNMIIP